MADSPTSILPQMTQQRKPATLIPLPLPETGSGPGRCQTIRADGMGGELAQGSGKEQPLPPLSLIHISEPTRPITTSRMPSSA